MIGRAFTVLNTLGAGFLEKVHENALAFELRAAGLSVAQQSGANVYYHDQVVGEYFVDLLVEDVLLVELKTAKALDDPNQMQCVNDVKATGTSKRLASGLSAAQFRQAASGDQARGARPVKRTDPFA